jgi:hypothetical protein
MVTATLKATPTPAGDSATGIRIRRALQAPGAKGKKGLLLWVNAAFPKAIADKVIAAAAKHVTPGMAAASTAAASGPQAGNVVATANTMGAFRGMRGLGRFGDTFPTLMTIGIDPTSVSDSASAAVINATDSSAADPSWVSSISSALQLASQAYLTKTQVDATNQIFNTNLSLAQRGLPLIPTNPTAYGLPAPTVNFGLSPGTMSKGIMVVGGVLGVWLLISLTSGKRKHA